MSAQSVAGSSIQMIVTSIAGVTGAVALILHLLGRV